MDQILYEYSPNGLRLIIPPILMILSIFFNGWLLFKFLKRININRPVKNIISFFVFNVFLFSVIFLVVMLIKIPFALQKQIQINRSLERKTYFVDKGIINDYHVQQSQGHISESFELNGYDYNLMSHKGSALKLKRESKRGPFLESNLNCKVFYFKSEEDRIILKIERQ